MELETNYKFLKAIMLERYKRIPRKLKKEIKNSKKITIVDCYPKKEEIKNVPQFGKDITFTCEWLE